MGPGSRIPPVRVTARKLEQIRNALRQGKTVEIHGRKVEWAWKGEDMLVVEAKTRRPLQII